MILVTSLSNKGNDDKQKKLLLQNSDGIFIPENPTYNELYIQELSNTNEYVKYINIIPYADKLISKNGFYDLISTYFNNQKDIINKIVPKSYILQNDIQRKEFDEDFYINFPNKIYILKKNIDRKKGLKIIKIKEKENLIDLYNIYFNDDYKIVQEYITNPYLYNNKIVILRVYLLIVRLKNEIKFIRQGWIKCLYSKYDFNLQNDKSMISDSSFNSPNFPKNLNELFTVNTSNNIKIINQIDNIFLKIKEASNHLLTNKILFDSILFQLFGCDFIIDDNLNVKLLEINKNPNLVNNFNKEEENIKNTMIKEMYDYIRNL